MHRHEKINSYDNNYKINNYKFINIHNATFGYVFYVTHTSLNANYVMNIIFLVLLTNLNNC